MTSRMLKPTTMRLDVDLLEGLRRIKQRDGIGVTEQVRRAIRAWLEQKGASPKPSTRRRSKGGA